MLTVARESPLQKEIGALIAALDAQMSALYPPEDNYLLSPETLAVDNVLFFVARLSGRAVGCGALVVEDGWGEIKRMYVAPWTRRRGIGRALLAALEEAARARRLSVLQLETGNLQAEAIALYEGCGYRLCAPFADYGASRTSVYLRKDLAAEN